MFLEFRKDHDSKLEFLKKKREDLQSCFIKDATLNVVRIQLGRFELIAIPTIYVHGRTIHRMDHLMV